MRGGAVEDAELELHFRRQRLFPRHIVSSAWMSPTSFGRSKVITWASASTSLRNRWDARAWRVIGAGWGARFALRHYDGVWLYNGCQSMAMQPWRFVLLILRRWLRQEEEKEEKLSWLGVNKIGDTNESPGLEAWPTCCFLSSPYMMHKPKACAAFIAGNNSTNYTEHITVKWSILRTVSAWTVVGVGSF